MKKGVRIFGKIAIIGVGIAAVLAIAVQVVGSAYVKPLIISQLEKVIYNGSDSLYTLHYSHANINLWTGSISIHNAHIYADSSQFNRLREKDALPPVTGKLRLEKGEISGFQVLSFLFHKEISISKISSENAEISLYRHFHHNHPMAVQRTSPPLWKLLRPGIQRLYVGEIALDNIKLSYYNRDSSTAFQWKFEQFNTLLSDILVDSASAMDTKRLLYMGNIETQIYDISLFSPDSLYKLNMGNFTYSMKERTAEVNDFKLEPTLSSKQFYKRTGVEKDIYHFEIPSLKLLHFKPELFLTDNTLMADSVLLKSASLEIYHDRTPPDDPTSKLGKFPHQLLLKSPFYIRIREVLGTDISISYTEKDSKTLREGKLVFTHIAGEASNLTNHPDDIALNSVNEVKVTGTMMKRTNIKGRFLFDLTKTDGSFEAEAYISPTDVRILNPVTEALAAARFNSLNTGQVHYKIKGNEHVAYGYLEMPYTDLHLEILNYVDPGQDPKHKKMQSWVIKTFSHNSNPGKDGEFRVATHIKEERNIHRSFFNLIWRTMFTCAKDVAMKENVKKIYQKRQERKKAKENTHAVARK